MGGRWENEFDGATGILAGAAAGYSFAGQNPNGPLGGLRVELEYFYRQSNYNQTADIPLGGVGTQGQKLRDEIVQATDRIGSITSHNLFGNLFYDFVNTSRFTPYIGYWRRRRIHRYGVWKRVGAERRREQDLDG